MYIYIYTNMMISGHDFDVGACRKYDLGFHDDHVINVVTHIRAGNYNVRLLTCLSN